VLTRGLDVVLCGTGERATDDAHALAADVDAAQLGADRVDLAAGAAEPRGHRVEVVRVDIDGLAAAAGAA
jgi:hypothetical protein